MNNSTRTNRTSAYTPNMDKPTSQRRSSRGNFGLILTLLLPPLGLMFLWRNGVFRVRGRMLLTAVATIEMMVFFLIAMPGDQLFTDHPVPAVPPAVTAAPQNDVITALSNIDQLLAEQQALNPTVYEDEQEHVLTAEERAILEAEQEAILDSIVYCVYGSDARYYHSREVCGTQSNRRALTVRDAIGLYLGACPDCDPPTYTGVAW